MLSQLQNIIPSLLQAHSPESIFKVVAGGALCGRQFATARPLLLAVLRLLYADVAAAPPSSTMLQQVARAIELANSKDLTDDCLLPLIEQDGREGDAVPVDVATVSSGLDDEDFRLLLPLVGGMSGSEVERCLPRIVAVLSAEMESLRSVLNTVVKSRPPPLAKTALLVALHRYVTTTLFNNGDCPD